MDTIGISYGRFNPPHKGHVAVWKQASTCNHFYIGTNGTTSGKDDPLPYDIKIKFMEAIFPEIQGHIVKEQNLFTLATNVYNNHGTNNELLVCTDELWLTTSLKKYNGVKSTHGYYNFNSIKHVNTPRISSSTELRNAVKNNDRHSFYNISGIPEDTEITINNRVFKFFDIVEEYLIK